MCIHICIFYVYLYLYFYINLYLYASGEYLWCHLASRGKPGAGILSCTVIKTYLHALHFSAHSICTKTNVNVNKIQIRIRHEYRYKSINTLLLSFVFFCLLNVLCLNAFRCRIDKSVKVSSLNPFVICIFEFVFLVFAHRMYCASMHLDAELNTLYVFVSPGRIHTWEEGCRGCSWCRAVRRRKKSFIFIFIISITLLSLSFI